MDTQRVIVFGASGRVGRSLVDQALDAGHEVTAFVRDPARLGRTHERLRVVQGDIYRPRSVVEALAPGFDSVVMTVGADPLRPSTVVRDTAFTLANAMLETGLTRYLGITGTAQMPATRPGRVTQFFIRHLIRAAADHQAAYEVITASTLDYALAACPYIKDGGRTGRYHEEWGRFPGGYKTVSAGDVADFFTREIGRPRLHRQVVGLWY